MRTNHWSAFTLATFLLIVVGIGYNPNAGAKPPKEKTAVTKTVKKVKPADTMPPMLVIKTTGGDGIEFVMGPSGKGMGFSGTGTGGGNGGFTRIHGLGKQPVTKATTKVAKKKTRVKPVQKEGNPVNSQPPVGCSCPLLEAPLNMTLER